MLRTAIVMTSVLLAAAAPALAQPAPRPPAQRPAAETGGFQRFLAGLWPQAQARGISRRTFDAAFAGLTPDASIVAITRRQSEFVQPIWGYIDNAASAARITRGRQARAEFEGVLAQLESRTGVPREVVLGIWGMETNFGSFTGDKDVIRSLATLASIRYRGDFFRDELLTALEILEKGYARRAQMRGSWAGAMGHTQFMPSSYMSYAVSYRDGSHVADVWGSPADALASTANYLAQKGWTRGLPWGLEVAVPRGYDYRRNRGSFASFAAAGITRVNGAALPTSGEARLFFPAGHAGPVFLLTSNFDVIKTYNMSDAYGLGVAHLGDRIMGRAAIAGTWPRNAPRLGSAEIRDLQRRLKVLGLYEFEADGRVGTGTREATRQFQLRAGLVADGYPTPAVLARLRAGR